MYNGIRQLHGFDYLDRYEISDVRTDGQVVGGLLMASGVVGLASQFMKGKSLALSQRMSLGLLAAFATYTGLTMIRVTRSTVPAVR